nr:MAG TPA: hypothetical protein [Caudoviricetes sp.]
MVLCDEPKIRLEIRVYDKNSRAAFLVNDDKETSVHIAKIYTMCGQLYVEDTYKVVKVTDMQEAVKQFNYIVTIAVDNISFLLEGV